MTPLFPIVLAAHVALAIGLLLPSVALPFLVRDGVLTGVRRAAASWLLQLQSEGAVPIALGVAATGVGLLLLVGVELLQRGWLLAAIVLYALDLIVAVAIARPELRGLIRARDDAEWRTRARRARWVAYGMAALIGVIGVLMTTKPALG